MKHQDIGETIIRLAYQRGSIASLLETFQAWCNMQEHQPIDAPSGSQSRVSPAYALCSLCANPPPSATPPKRLCLSHLCRNWKHSRQSWTNMPATEHACHGTCLPGTCLPRDIPPIGMPRGQSVAGPSYIWNCRQSRYRIIPCSPVLRVPGTLTIYLPDLNCIH